MLATLNGFLVYLYQGLIKRIEISWGKLLEDAALPAITQNTFEYGIYGMTLLFTLSLIAAIWSTAERKRKREAFWSSSFAILSLTEITSLAFITLGLTLPLITITTHLSG